MQIVSFEDMYQHLHTVVEQDEVQGSESQEEAVKMNQYVQVPDSYVTAVNGLLQVKSLFPSVTASLRS